MERYGVCMGLPMQAKWPSPIVWRAVRSAAIRKDRDSVRTKQNPARPGDEVQHNRFLDIAIRYLNLNT